MKHPELAKLYSALGSLAIARLEGEQVSRDDVRNAIFEATGIAVEKASTSPACFSIDWSEDGGRSWSDWSRGLAEDEANSFFESMLEEGDDRLSLRIVDERDESLTRAHIAL